MCKCPFVYDIANSGLEFCIPKFAKCRIERSFLECSLNIVAASRGFQYFGKVYGIWRVNLV